MPEPPTAEPARLAVISGGGSGLGRAFALEAARRGHALALLGRRVEPLRAVLAAAAANGDCWPCDVRDAAAVAGSAEAILASSGVPDLVVAAAGRAWIGPFASTTDAEFAAVIDTNLAGTQRLFRAFLPAMLERRRGTLVALLSVAARRGFPGWSAYCASKWGLAGLMAALREETAGSGVGVLAVYPGATATPLWDGLAGTWDRSRMMLPESVAAATLAALDAAGPGAALEELHLGPPGGPL